MHRPVIQTSSLTTGPMSFSLASRLPDPATKIKRNRSPREDAECLASRKDHANRLCARRGLSVRIVWGQNANLSREQDNACAENETIRSLLGSSRISATDAASRPRDLSSVRPKQFRWSSLRSMRGVHNTRRHSQAEKEK